MPFTRAELDVTDSVAVGEALDRVSPDNLINCAAYTRVDAAETDEANIGRFISMLKEFKRNTQFVVITHNPRTMEAADWLYGVKMEELGVSWIVGVRLDEVLDGAKPSNITVGV